VRIALKQLNVQPHREHPLESQTDSRTTVDYLFAPVTAYLRRAMREPL